MVGRATTTLKLKRLVGITRVAKLSSAKRLENPASCPNVSSEATTRVLT